MALLADLSRQGHTIILITHDAKVAAHAQRQIELKDGQIISDSGPLHPLHRLWQPMLRAWPRAKRRCCASWPLR